MSERTKAIFDQDYDGPRYRYGMRNRPLMYGAQPGRFVVGSQRPSEDPRYPHGTVDYPVPLSRAERERYELEPVLLFDGGEMATPLLLALALAEDRLEPIDAALLADVAYSATTPQLVTVALASVMGVRLDRAWRGIA